MPRKHDPQKDAVYAWQWKWYDWNHGELSKDGVRQWVKWAYKKKFRFTKMPRIKFPKTGKCSYHDGEKALLAFVYEHRNVPMVLHETAHAICFILYGATVEDHGPEFMGIFLYLLEKTGHYPLGTVYDSAKKAGLKIDGSQGPKLIKRSRK